MGRYLDLLDQAVRDKPPFPRRFSRISQRDENIGNATACHNREGVIAFNAYENTRERRAERDRGENALRGNAETSKIPDSVAFCQTETYAEIRENPQVAECKNSLAAVPDDPEERAAVVEYGAGVPHRWAEGYAAIRTMPPPDGFSPERWQRIIDGAHRFMGQWAAKAAECGWSDLDVFGADPDGPDRRFDCMGLLLLLDRTEIVAIDTEGADLRSPPEAGLRYRRRPVPAHTVSLWELAE